MGSRVRNVMNELLGEKIDIVDYADEPANFVANALSPARVSRVHVVDLGAREAQVIVPDYQLSLAIGKEGQNARLAARLTGWRIDIRSDAAVSETPETPETPEKTQATKDAEAPEITQTIQASEAAAAAVNRADPQLQVAPGAEDVRTR
jgi:N utilization substance protein A